MKGNNVGLGVIGQLMRWHIHPHASESGSYIKASIFSGFYSGGAIVVTYLFTW